MTLQILALRYISLSEIQKVMPKVNRTWYTADKEVFDELLWSLGLDTKLPYEYQEDINHRNFFNEIVFGDRVVGYERIDAEWIDSGHASETAKDKSKSNSLLVDLYRLKGEVELED